MYSFIHFNIILDLAPDHVILCKAGQALLYCKKDQVQ